MNFLRKTLLWLLLAPYALFATVTPAMKVVQRKATHSIVMLNEKEHESAGCSATAISEHVLLTAEHCNIAGAVVYLDQSRKPFQHPLDVSERYLDHQDHMLLVIPGVSFKNLVDYGSALPLRQGDHYYMWGNPGMINNQYREGYVTGSVINPLDGDVIDVVSSFLMLSGPVVGGDSGSAVFSAEDSHIAGVLTYGIEYGMFAGVYPLAFTSDQIAQAKGNGTFVYLPDNRTSVAVSVNAPAPTPAAMNIDMLQPTLALIALILAFPILSKVVKVLAWTVRRAAGPVYSAMKYFGRLLKHIYQSAKGI